MVGLLLLISLVFGYIELHSDCVHVIYLSLGLDGTNMKKLCRLCAYSCLWWKNGRNFQLLYELLIRYKHMKIYYNEYDKVTTLY